MVENLLTYDGLINYLKKNYEEISNGEFIVFKDEKKEIDVTLIVKLGKDYKKDLKELKNELLKSRGVTEGIRKHFGILFVDNYIIFLRRVMEGLEPKILVLRKSIDKISPAFKKKLKKLSKDFGNLSYWDELFDRSDIVEEFYRLYLKVREKLIENIKGFEDDKEKIEFADNLLMQLLIIWYLQEKGFLDGNKRYLIEKFKEYKNLGFNNYYDFLKELFIKMSGYNVKNPYYVDEKFGKIVITGPAPFLNGEFKDNDNIQIPDEIFYKGDKITEILKKIEPKNIKIDDVSILNLFESRDWTEGNIDEYVLGAIFEKLMNAEERKEKGAYYTPEAITKYISENTIYPYLVDKINEKFKTNYKSLKEFFEKDNDLEKYRYLYEVLQDIKILDPACGSGHFLETAIEVLVEIYKKLKDKIEKLGFDENKFIIKVADDSGDIKNENLLSINDEEEFKLKVKFHIIISRNIYGVDIQKSAIKVARARMFLTLAKHFNPEKGILVRFPNVHFNLRSGNSLIGFADFSGLKKVAKGTQITLDDFFKSAKNYSKVKTSESFELKISNEEFKNYLSNLDKKLNLNLMESLKEVKKIYNDKINEENIKKVLELKTKLIRALLISLNSDFVNDIKSMLDLINDSFNEKLNNEFVDFLNEKGVKITDKELRNIGYFHWIMEFSEVFIRRTPGFDIIIGNPPYGRIKQIIKDKKEKELHSKLYKVLYNYQIGNFNFYKLFLERSYVLLKNNGYFGMIFPSSFLGENDSKALRKLFFENARVYKILEFPEKTKVFEGKVTQAVTILLYCKEKREDYTISLKTNITREELLDLKNIEFLEIKKSELKGLLGDEYKIPLFSNPKIEWEILKHISKYPPFKGDKYISSIGNIGEGHLHETQDKEFMSDEPGDDLLIKGIHLDRYFVDLSPDGPKPRWIKNKEEFFKRKPEAKENAKFERIIGRNTINKASKPRLRFSLISPGYVLTNSIKFIVVNDDKIHKLYLISLLNSKLLNWRFELFSSQNNIRNYEIEALPIPRISLEEQKPFIILSKYLIFLKQYQKYFVEKDFHLQYIIEYFDNLIDCLVYELYLGDIIKIPIKSLIENKLKDIDLFINILEEEKNKVEDTLKIIKGVFENLESDKKLNENLYLIKLHPWVKQIYTSLGA